MNNKILVVRDMGIEIPVPDIDWGTKESTLLPQFRPGTDYVGNPETAMEFAGKHTQITRTSDGNYELDDIDNLRHALDYFYSYKANPRAPIINRVLDATGLDISEGKLFGNTKTSCSAMRGRTVTLEIRI